MPNAPDPDDVRIETGWRIGYGHASLIGILRPELAYPGRKVARGRTVTTTLYAEPCNCPDDHVEIWVRPYVEAADVVDDAE